MGAGNKTGSGEIERKGREGLEGIRCLLIDDDIDDQEIFSIALQRLDIRVDCEFAGGGKEALEKLTKDLSYKPHCIFIDINMPKMNGRECLGALKNIERLADVPVFMYSTSEDPNVIRETRLLGARDFIVKPATVSALRIILGTIFTDLSRKIHTP